MKRKNARTSVGLVHAGVLVLAREPLQRGHLRCRRCCIFGLDLSYAHQGLCKLVFIACSCGCAQFGSSGDDGSSHLGGGLAGTGQSPCARAHGRASFLKHGRRTSSRHRPIKSGFWLWQTRWFFFCEACDRVCPPFLESVTLCVCRARLRACSGAKLPPNFCACWSERAGHRGKWRP